MFLRAVVACAVAVSAEVFVSDSQDDNGVSFEPVNVVEEDIRNLGATTTPAPLGATTPAATATTLAPNQKVVYCDTNVLCPARSALTYALLAMFLGYCGADRCFLGNVCLGTVKGVTCGGCGVWALIDYFVFISVCFNKKASIDIMGMKSNFKPDSIDGAYTVACIAIGLMVCSVVTNCVGGCMSKGMSGGASSQSQDEESSD